MSEAGVPKGMLSVRDLVESRTSATDRWNLALVQRDEKWDPVRMRHLLDSMLAKYPIGAILLCRVADPSEVISRDGRTRTVQTASADEWQLVDGQQRINAFFSMLTDQGRYGKFLLHMTMRRDPPGPVQKRTSKDRLLPYIVWQEDPSTDIVDRELHIDLSRWAGWALSKTSLEATADTATALLRDLDPEFVGHLPPEAAHSAAERLNALWYAWDEPTIPALRAPVQSPADVLEIFTRVNLGGVDVVSSDVFFAAVKTYWSEAESRLDEMRDLASPLLRDRMRTLRFASRVASRAISSADLLPLSVDRLAGSAPHPLVTALDEITTPGSVVLQRLETFSKWFRESSELGYALRAVSPDLFDDVLAWAVVTPQTDARHYAQSLHAIDSYLLGATLFRYPSVMRDSYRRMAFLEAMTAGAAGEGFQTVLNRVLEVARAGSGLRGGRSAVDTYDVARSRQAGRYHDGSVLTGLAQRLPFDQQDMDGDHIFPQAQARRMWVKGQRGRRAHHRDRHLVNAGGNFWALNSSVNSSLQDVCGRTKFDRLDELAADGKIPARQHWALSDEEIATHIEVDELLDDTEPNIERAMVKFRDLVTGRSLRLWDEAIERFPQIKLFAADHQIDPDDPSVPIPFHEALGVTAPVAPPPPGPASRELPGPWSEKVAWTQWIVDDLARNRLKVEASRRNSKARGSGFTHGWWIWLGEPGPETWFAVGMAPQRPSKSGSPFWLQVNSETDAWEIVETRLHTSQFATSLESETASDSTITRIWIPLEATSDLGWHALLERLTEQAVSIRDTITGRVLDP